MPQEIAGSDFELETDLVIAALGFSPENLPKMFEVEELYLQYVLIFLRQ